jgi:hypothetical protein
MRPVSVFAALAGLLLIFTANLHSTEDKGGKKSEHAATIVTVNPKTQMITVEVDEKGAKKHKSYHLTESVKIVDASGKVTKIDVFKKGDHVKIVEHEGKLHELHHKGSGGK